MVLLVSLLTALVLVFTACSSSGGPTAPSAGQSTAATHEQFKLRYGCSQPGTSTYAMGWALQEIVNKNDPWLRCEAYESPGGVYSAQLFSQDHSVWTKELYGVGSDAFELLQQGKPPYEKYPLPSLRLIGNYFLASGFLMTLDPNIKTYKDLVGKKVAIGLKTQTLYGLYYNQIMRDGWGLADKIDIQWLGLEAGKDALLNGAVSATLGVINGTIVGGKVAKEPMAMPSYVQEVAASGRKVNYISFGKEEILKAQKANGIATAVTTVPTGALPGLDHDFDADLMLYTWSAMTQNGADPGLSDDVVYELTKCIVQNVTQFGDYDARGKMINPEMLVYGWPRSQLHPAAIKAYQDLGVKLPD